MRNDQNYTNVITKYNKWLTNGQKKALRKRADQISLQNAKTRSEAQTSAVQNLNKTNDYLSSMGLSSNLRKAPSSGVDEESRRMPEFRQQNQALKAQEQGVLDVYGRQAAAATKAARARAAAARKGNGLYRIVDPKTGEMMKDASGNYIWTSKKNKAAVERGETVAGINDTPKTQRYSTAGDTDSSAHWSAFKDRIMTGSVNTTGSNLYSVANNMSVSAYRGTDITALTGKVGETISKGITSAFDGLTSATAITPKTNGISDAKAEQNALIKKTKAVIRVSSVIQYAADVGAIPQATADIYITQVKNGTFDADKSGAYIISQINGKALDNAATNAGLMNSAVTSYVADGTPTLAQKTFFQAYTRAQQTGAMDDYKAVGEAYIEVIKEQNNSQLQVARGIVLDAIENGLNPHVGAQAIAAFKAGDTQGFLDYIDNGLVDASLQSIGNTTDSYLEQGLIAEQDAASVRALIDARDAQGAVDALNAGLEARFTEQLATQCEEWHTDAVSNDTIYKGDDANAWHHFDACYRVAKMSGTQEAWTRCQDAYLQLVQAEFNGQVAQAKIDANQAVKLGLSQSRADKAMLAFKSGDVETYINILNAVGFEDVPIGYVAAAEKDALLMKTVGIGYAAYMRYRYWSDEDIDNGIYNLTYGREVEIPRPEYAREEDPYDMRAVVHYRASVAQGMDPDKAMKKWDISTPIVKRFEGYTDEELKAVYEKVIPNYTSDKAQMLKELEAVKAARQIDKNTAKIKEYEELSLEEIDARIAANDGKLNDPNVDFKGLTGYLTKEEKEAIKADSVFLGYARSNKWQKQSALDYDTYVTKPVSDIRLEGNLDQVAADAYANADRANYAVQYGNGTWYYTNDEAESMLPEYMKDFSADRPIITADKFSELGWTGSNDGYFNAQVFKRADGKYVVMSTVTKDGVPMTPAWAMRYQDKLSNGSDPDGMQLGVYATKEEAEAAAQEADLTAANYVDRTGEFEGTEKVEGDAASALGVFKALSDPALIWYDSSTASMNDVKAAAAMFPEDSGTMGQLYLSAQETLDGRRMNAVAREAKNLGADTISSAYNWYAYATDDEKKLLAYYISTDLEAAGDYFKKVNPYINERVMNNVAEVASAASGAEVRDENGNVVQEASPLLYVAAKAGTYLLKPVEAAGGLYTLYQTVTGEDVDQNSKWFLPTVWNNSVRSTQYNALQAKFDAKYGKEAGQSKLGKCAVFAVQTLDSVVDSWVSAQLGQGIAEGTVGQGISLAGMGLGAVASTTKELLDAGVPQDMAKRLGIMAGIFEALFEVVSLDKIVHGADDLTKSAIKRITIGGVVEGSEEMFTEAANLAASSWVLGYSSDYNKEIAELMTGGMSYSAAASKATMNQAMGVLIAGAGGFLSGGLSGTTNAIRADINTSQTGAAIRESGGANTLIETAQNSTDAEVKKAWSTIAAGYETNKNVSNLDLGRLNYAIAMSDAKAVTGKIDSMVDDGLIEANEAKAIKEYVNGVYENSAHGMASTVYGFNLDTTALEGVSETAIAAVSKAVYETTEGRTPAQTTTTTASTVKTEVTAETATEILQQDVVKEETVHGVNVVHHTTGELSATDKAKVKFAEAMAKASGLELVVHDTLPINGVMADGKLNVALDTDRGFVSTVAHELTHWLKNNASNESYNALVNFLTNEANKARRDGFNELVEKKMVEYRDLHPNVTEEQLRQIATDETVATLCETMLNDETFVRELVQKDRNLFEKIYEWINSVLNQFRNILASDKDIRGIKEAERLVQDMEEARDLWYKCLQEAKNGEQTEGDERFSKKDTRTEMQKAEDEIREAEENGVYVSDDVKRVYKGQIQAYDELVQEFGMKASVDKIMRKLRKDGSTKSTQMLRVRAEEIYNEIHNRPTLAEAIRNEGFGNADRDTRVAMYMKRLLGNKFNETVRDGTEAYTALINAGVEENAAYAFGNALDEYLIAMEKSGNDFTDEAVVQTKEKLDSAAADIKGEGIEAATAFGNASDEDDDIAIAEPTETVEEIEQEELVELFNSGKELPKFLRKKYDSYVAEQRQTDTRTEEQAPAIEERAEEKVLESTISETEPAESVVENTTEAEQNPTYSTMNPSGDINGVPVYDIRKTASENLNTAETEETKAVEQFGKDSVEAEAAAKKADEAYVAEQEARKESLRNTFGLTAEEYEEDMRYEAEQNEAEAEAKRQAAEDREAVLDAEVERARADVKEKVAERQWTEADKREQDKRIAKLQKNVDYWQNRYDNEQDVQAQKKIGYKLRDAQDALARAMRTRERMNRNGRVAPRPTDAGTPDLDTAAASIVEEERTVIGENGKETKTSVPEVIEKILLGAQRVARWSMMAPEKMIDAVSGKNTELKEILNDLIQRPLNEAGSRYTKNLIARKGQFDAEMRRLGIVGDKSKAGIEMTRKKSAAIQKYGEGFYYNAEGERISYTLDDLKQEFPEDWQNIVQAEQYCRDVYDDYHDMYNSMLEKIYPDVIEHLETDAKKLQAMVDKETAKRNNQLKLVGELEANLEEKRTLLASKKSGTQVYATLENQIVSIQAQLENAQHLAELYEHKAQLRAQQRDAILKGIETGDLVRNRRLMRRNDYYHHFTKQQEGLARLRQIWYEEESDIDPMLVGKTDQTNPRKGYAGFAQKRLGEKTEVDAIKGMHLYMNEIEKRLAYDPVASHYKTLIDQLRKNGSTGLESGQLKDANDLIRWLEEERNQIVGKSSMIDRKVSDWGIAPRKFVKVMQWLNSRDKSNRVPGNLRSAIVQASNLTNAVLFVRDLSDWGNAIRNMIASYTNSSVGEMVRETIAQSEFIQQRYNLEDLEYDEKEISPKQIALKMMGALDQFAGKLMWWAAYNQYNASEAAKKNGTKSRGLADTGRTYRNAIEYADDITRRSTAGRGIGELAPVMTSSVVNLLSPFQVEVNNTWQNYKKAIGDKNWKGLMAFSLLTYTMNTIGEALYGDRSLPFDIIDALVSAIEGAFGDDDDDEEEKTTLSRVGNFAKLFGQNTASTFMNGIPMKSLLDMFAGETISEITGTEASTPNVLGASTVVESAKGVLDFVKKAAKGQINSVDEAWTLALQDSDWMNLVLPWGGTQAQRTLKGLDAALRGYSQRMNNEGELEAQFALSGMDAVKAPLFGKWATEGGRAYLDGDTRALDAETTARMKEAQKTGMSPVDFFKSLAELKAVTGEKDADGKTAVTKSSAQFSALAESDMTDEQMQLMLDSLGKTNAMRDRYNADDSGIGVSTFLSYAADYGDKTDLAEDESQTTAFLKRVADDENLTDAQKIAMTQIVLGSNSKNAVAKMSAASAAGVSISNLVKYDKMAADKDGKLQALMDDTTMNASEKSALYKVLYPDGKERDFTNQALFELSGRSDEMVARGKVAIANGVPGEKVNEYYTIKVEKDTDPETGASTSIGKEAVLTQLFEDTSLTAEQKDVLATALYPNGKKRDWSSRSMFELSGMTDNEYSKAQVAISNGVPATKALEYLKVTKETKYDAVTGHTSKIGKDAVLERVMADKHMTPKQKLAVEVMLYPTDSKRRDYTNADWFYLSSTSSGTEGKAYKCAKQAVEAGIPLSACVAETKEYLRMKAAGEGSGKNGGMTQKDTKKICYRLGLTDRQAAIMFKIYK